jgi:hypothetical protein
MKCLVLDSYFSAILQYNIHNLFTTRSPQIQKNKKIFLSEKIKDDNGLYDSINCGASFYIQILPNLSDKKIERDLIFPSSSDYSDYG